MVDEKCSKNYPRDFAEETRFGDDGYPEYMRSNNGRTYTKPHVDHVFTNRDVIPHNPYLSAQYNYHINIEICSSIKAVKYIHKYIYKGHDLATVEVGQEINEIKDYINGRYIGLSEAC
jgi:hypothetical protein